MDENANYTNTLWCNRDLIPIPSERRTWTWQGYAGYWIIAGGRFKIRLLENALIPLKVSIHRHGPWAQVY